MKSWTDIANLYGGIVQNVVKLICVHPKSGYTIKRDIWNHVHIVKGIDEKEVILYRKKRGIRLSCLINKPMPLFLVVK